MKKILLIFTCVFLCFSFSFNAFAETIVETSVLSYDADDWYSLMSNYNVSNLSVNDDVCTFRPNGFFVVNTTQLDCSSEYHIVGNFTGGLRVQIQYVTKYNNGTPVGWAYRNYTESFDITMSDLTRIQFTTVNNNAINDFYSFSAFSIDRLPDPVIQGDSSDFGVFIVPFISKIVNDTWNVFKSCWWVMALLVLPIVYLIFCVISNIFRTDKIKDFVKNNSISKLKLKHTNPRFKNKKIQYADYINIDGVNYFNFYSLKNKKIKKSDYFSKKSNRHNKSIDFNKKKAIFPLISRLKISKNLRKE